MAPSTQASTMIRNTAGSSVQTRPDSDSMSKIATTNPTRSAGSAREVRNTPNASTTMTTRVVSWSSCRVLTTPGWVIQRAEAVTTATRGTPAMPPG